MRERLGLVALLALLVVAALLAWLTGHPESPWIDRAVDWPLVGSLAERFREAYRPAPPPSSSAAGGEDARSVIVVIPVPPDEEPADGRQGPGGEGALEARPPRAAGPPPLGRDPEPVRPVAARPPSREQLALAERILGARTARSSLGPYALLLDAEAEAPLTRWGELATALEAGYLERYGVAPTGRPAETVVLFAREADYRELQGQDERLVGLDASGHAGGGLAALWIAGRSRDEAESTLVHELGHFLQRRALGPALPPWLDEGLAEDLAQTPFEAGELRFGSSRIDLERNGPRVVLRGALAALDEADRAALAGELPPLATLVSLDWREFVGSSVKLHYGEALWFVRYLLDGGEPARAAGFRSFLAAIAAGERADGERLLAALGEDWPTLDRGFRAWLRDERQRRLIALGLPSRSPEAALSGDRR